MSHSTEGELALSGVYALTPDDNLLPRLLALVESALAGGVRWVQYRNKMAPPSLRRIEASALLKVCNAHGAKLIINDDVWLAVEIGAHGAHVGRDDLPGGSLETARNALGPNRILGVSCYDDLARAEVAVEAGADYIAFGSLFPSVSKPQATRASLEVIREAKRRFSVPVVGIGGITTQNARQVFEAGADMIAVLSDLFDAMDIRKQAEKFHQLFKEHRS
ncbi:MAG: thiamine phosphate synthase [Pseudomonadota bacterium]|uniref:thiamine phosphate synthase n=1 Tax=Sulfuricystis thermophila TaxID=2496847 RepID=UPI001036BF83|nr:thiamine phosphate synthase [Sulfuricystis thermophila]MDI6748970.1 thiamine phosphate synthase [Rhodocyclaceae bacterium]